jgi:hypothetical protein
MSTAAETAVTRIRVRLAIVNQPQAWLARQLGWTEARLSTRMTGKTPFAIDELADVADVFNTDLVGLLNGAAA